MKKFLFIVAIVLCSMFICSCAGNNTAVYYYGDDNSHFGYQYNIPERYVSPSSNRKIPDIQPEDKTFVLGDEEFILTYKESDYYGSRTYICDQYQTQDGSLKVYFRRDTGEPETVTYYDGYAIDVSEPITSEDKLLAVAGKIARSYVSERISKYTHSVDTTVVQYTDHGMSSIPYDGYSPASLYPDCDVSYTVRYRYYIGEYATDDALLVRLTSEGLFVSVSLNMISAYDSFEISEKQGAQYAAKIDETVAAMCDVEGYLLKTYEKAPMLIHVDGNLCMRYLITPEIVSTDTNETVSARDLTLLIPINP